MTKQQTSQELGSKDLQEIHANFNEVKTILTWEAPGRPFKKRTREYYATVLIIMFFVEVILFLFSMYLEMLVVLSFVFLAFTFSAVPPHNFKFRISSEGIFVEDHYSLWQELYDFFIDHQNNQEVIVVRTRTIFPGEIILTPNGEVNIESIKKALLPYLPFREYIPPTFVDKASTWMTKNFPLEPVEKVKKVHKVAS